MAATQPRFPTRSRRYGIGKEVGYATYVHRTYEGRIGQAVQDAKQRLPATFDYTVVKYRSDTATVSFIHSPDFDTSPEPTVGDIWIVFADGRSQLRRQAADPFIYHHKWMFVADDYSGFDVEESKARSRAWTALADVDRTRIGRRSYWEREVLPHL